MALYSRKYDHIPDCRKSVDVTEKMLAKARDQSTRLPCEPKARYESAPT